MNSIAVPAAAVLICALLAGCAAQPEPTELGAWKAEQAKTAADQKNVLGILSANVSKGSGEQTSVTLGLPDDSPAHSVVFSCYGTGVIKGSVGLKVDGREENHRFGSLQCGNSPQILDIDAKVVARARSITFRVESSTAESAWQLVAKGESIN